MCLLTMRICPDSSSDFTDSFLSSELTDSKQICHNYLHQMERRVSAIFFFIENPSARASTASFFLSWYQIYRNPGSFASLILVLFFVVRRSRLLPRVLLCKHNRNILLALHNRTPSCTKQPCIHSRKVISFLPSSSMIVSRGL